MTAIKSLVAQTKLFWVLFAASLVFVTTGCGDDEPDPGACAADTTAPTATATPASPTSSGGTTASFELTFSESVTGVAEAVSVSGGATVSVEGSGTTYTVTVSGLTPPGSNVVTVAASGVSDDCGNALASDFTYTINATPDCSTDMTAPTVSVGPSNPIVLPPTTMFVDVTFTFDELVEALTAASFNVDNGAAVESVTQNGNDWVVRISGLAEGQTNLVLPGATADLCGNAIGTDTTVVIDVEPDDQTPPMVMSTVPADSATDVSAASTIEINFTEPVVATSGTVTVDAGGVITTTSAFTNGDQTLTLTPDSPLPYDTLVTVTVADYEDPTGNVMAPAFTFTFTVEVDPCLGIPATSSLANGVTAIAPLGTGGTAVVGLAFSDAFALEESMIAVTATNGGSGTLMTGSLTGSGTSWTFMLQNVNATETYDVVLANTTSTDMCTALTGGTVGVTVTDGIQMSGACPLPPTLAQHHTATDACDAGTNSTLANSEATGFTLAAVGDAFSISGIYDSDAIGGSDNDFFSFQVMEDGINATELRVSVAYGCNFSGTGTPGAWSPIFDIWDDVGAEVGTFTANDDYSSFSGSGNYGSGQGSILLGGPAGTNTYHLWIDDNVGSNWCMDYVVYIEHVDDTLPLVCIGASPNASLVTTSTSAYGPGTNATVVFELDNGYDLQQSDLTLVANTGTGTLMPGSLMGNGTSFSVELMGTAPGDSYTLQLANGTDQCGTTLAAGSFTFDVTDLPVASGSCPLPPAFTNHHVGADICDAGTNSTLANSEPTGFTLATIGDEFSIAAIYDADSIGGSDNDFFSFDLVENGTNATELEIAIAYGCNFTGTGTRPAAAPLVQLRDNTGSVVGSLNGNNDYDDVDGSGTWGAGSGSILVAGPAGTNTYHLWVDDVSGANWCMDYHLYVRHIDDTFPAVCVGAQPTTTLASNGSVAFAPGSTATATIEFADGYDLAESDISLVANVGSGTLVPNSLAGGPTEYTIDITGVAAGDSYTLQIAANTDQCGTAFAGDSVAVSVTDFPVVSGMCPLPPTLAQHFAAPDACGQQTNSTVATAAVTGFTLTNPGDAFSIGGIYDSDGSDFDYFAFDVVSDGVSTYTVEVAIAYGCTFTGTGTPGAWQPDIDLFDTGGTTSIGSFFGNDDYSDIDGTGFYGAGGTLLSILPADNPIGTNTFYLRLDDNVGSGWCMDYSFFVRLVSVN